MARRIGIPHQDNQGSEEDLSPRMARISRIRFFTAEYAEYADKGA